MPSPLGRGLGSLIPTKLTSPALPADSGEPKGAVQRLPLSRLAPNPHQPRATISHDSLEELIASVKEHGILQPLVVTLKGRDYEIIAGERRFQAAKIAGLKTVPVIVRDVNTQQQLELALVENLQRQDLNPIEESLAYHRLAEEFNLTQEQIAQRVGKSRSYVANTLRLRTLSATAQKAIRDGKISEGHAKALLALASEEEQDALLRSILQQGLTVRDAEAAAHRRKPGRSSRPRPQSAELAELAETLQQRLGTRVTIRQSAGRGTISIEFYSREELASLIRQLTRDT